MQLYHINYLHKLFEGSLLGSVQTLHASLHGEVMAFLRLIPDKLYYFLRQSTSSFADLGQCLESFSTEFVPEINENNNS